MTTKKTVATTAKVAVKKVPVKKAQAKKISVPVKPVAKPAIRHDAGLAAESVLKKTKKEHKQKVVRDSFTMPQDEYQKIAEIKATCLKANMHVKKSEILRAGLKMLAESGVAQLKLALSSVEKIKTGRPQKH